MRSNGRVCLLCVLVGLQSSALRAADFGRADLNGSGKIDTEEEGRILAIYRVSPTIAEFDTITVNGAIDPSEMPLINAQAEKDLQAQIFQAGLLIDQATSPNGIPVAEIQTSRSPPPDPCALGQGFYVRRDRLDVAAYTQSVPRSAAKGAAFKVTDDFDGDVSATIDGTFTYVWLRNPCRHRPAEVGTEEMYLSGYAVAPFVLASGELLEDTKRDKSKLQAGIDLKAELFSGPLFNAQYISILPYYQTDFDGNANIFGVQAAWMPYRFGWKLGATHQTFSDYFDFFWTLELAADGRHIDDAGSTGLKPNSDSVWLGGSVRLNSWLFPAKFDERIYFDAGFSHFWDPVTDESASLFEAALGYNITDDGSTSVSLEYLDGTDKDTLEEDEKVTLNLNFKH